MGTEKEEGHKKRERLRMKQYKRTIMMMTMLILLAIAFVPIIWLMVGKGTNNNT